MASEKVSDSAGNPPAYTPPPITSPPAPQNVVPVQMTAITIATPVGTTSQAIVCRSCNKEVVTQILHNTTTKTHLIAALLCVSLMWPCAIATYFVNSCKSIDHYCPNCQAYIGSYKN